MLQGCILLVISTALKVTCLPDIKLCIPLQRTKDLCVVEKYLFVYCENGTNDTRNLCGRSAALLMLTQMVWLPFVQISQFKINECHTLCLAHIDYAFLVSPDISVCILKGHVEFRCGFSSTVARLYLISYQ